MIIEANVADGFKSGWLSVGMTTVPLSTKTLISKFGVQLKAASDNTGIIYVGGPDVTADRNARTGGYPLAANECLFIPVDHLENVNLISDTVGQALAMLILS